MLTVPCSPRTAHRMPCREGTDRAMVAATRSSKRSPLGRRPQMKQVQASLNRIQLDLFGVANRTLGHSFGGYT
jgi:hypothetical protein